MTKRISSAEEHGFAALTPESFSEVVKSIRQATDARNFPTYFKPTELVVVPELLDLANEVVGDFNVIAVVTDEGRLPPLAAWAVVASGARMRVYCCKTATGVIEAKAEYMV